MSEFSGSVPVSGLGFGRAARVRLKVCCISSVEEAGQAIAAGADALGLVAAMPTGPGPIPDAVIARIARAVPPPVATFLLTSRTDPEGVVAHVLGTGVNTVQLVDDAVDAAVYAALRARAPGVRIVQVVHVRDGASEARALEAAPLVDALLLDSGNPAMRELGGTGRAHDWAISRRIVERAGCPVFLAGGLHAGNIGEAVATVRPFGVDLCSGVRTSGALDAAKLAAFVGALRAHG